MSSRAPGTAVTDFQTVAELLELQLLPSAATELATTPRTIVHTLSSSAAVPHPCGCGVHGRLVTGFVQRIFGAPRVHSNSSSGKGVNHYGPMNCDVRIANRPLDAQAYTFIGSLARSDHFIEFTVSKRASQVQSQVTQ
ncbi:hypothetical protein CRG98_029676 [Punica granatum]|uniref:Uncharacterized protein n=1 Tax=Punica granatum TaxID=22663 RepID=A0A2I0J125_PUNGR|nr:hypothetical protein CRG98_029676 [Punica granatum]